MIKSIKDCKSVDDLYQFIDGGKIPTIIKNYNNYPNKSNINVITGVNTGDTNIQAFISKNTYEVLVNIYITDLRDILKLESNIPSVHDLILINTLNNCSVISNDQVCSEILEIYSKRT